MSTLRSTLAKFGIPLTGVWLILTGIAALGIFSVPAIIMGILAILAGICLLCAS